MEIILLEKVENLGNIGDKVRVKSGYGRNFLLPKGKATLATPENIAEFEKRRAEFEKREADDLAEAEARRAQLEGMNLRMKAKAGPEGKLFGSLGTIDIADACTAAGVEVQRSEVRLPNGPIRTLGEHEIEFHLHTDVNVTVHISVVGENVSDEELALLEQAASPDAAGTADDAATGDESEADKD